MCAYRHRGGDTMHLKWGMARYADGSQYSGAFQAGRPHTSSGSTATLKQHERVDGGSRWGPLTAVYTGEFQNGVRCGQGKYEVMGSDGKPGITYNGSWADNRRNGAGKQEVVRAMQAEVGYESYDGEWKKDIREGKGTMIFRGEDDSKAAPYKFIGAFAGNNRTGKGKMYLGKHLIFNGHWSEDSIVGTPDKPVWARFLGADAAKEEDRKTGLAAGVGAIIGGTKKEDKGQASSSRGFYYGEMNSAGMREGKGTLFSESARDDKKFMRCFEEGIPWSETDPVFSGPKHMTYDGPWRNNLPHGQARQHFPHLGTYDGQFVNGKRHGRGTWTTDGGKRMFKPLPNSQITNWENDLMHGVGIVEDEQHVHENVIYTNGHCQMPFTDMGPPLTGFDDTLVIGSLIKGTRKGANIMSSKHGDHKLAVTSHGDNEKNHFMLATGNQNKLGPGAVDVADDIEDAIVREPTDLNLPEEDILVTGGTEENALINGLYFKLSGTFGMSVFKHVKRTSQGMGRWVHAERYLFQDPKGSIWIIGTSPFCNRPNAAGCAFVEDEALHPGAITTHWFVWSQARRHMIQYDPAEAAESREQASRQTVSAFGRRGKPVVFIDEIRAKSVVGFEVVNVSREFALQPGLMLRHNQEVYGRPVYEAESGGQFLYWLQRDGSVEEGLDSAHVDSVGEALSARDLFANHGAWVIASEVGPKPNSPGCLAYIEDISVTPDQIRPDLKWMARRLNGDKFVECPTMRLQLEEWSRDTGLLATFDEDEGHEAVPLLGGR